MPIVSRWGPSADTVERTDWICDRSLGKVSLLNVGFCTPIAAPAPPASPPVGGPKNTQAALALPSVGPASMQALPGLPSVGPASVQAALGVPSVGPATLTAELLTLNISPLLARQINFDDPATGSAGDILYSEDVDFLFIRNVVEWHRLDGK